MKAQPKDDPRMGEQPFDKEWWDSLDPEHRAELEQVMAEIFARLDQLEAKHHR